MDDFNDDEGGMNDANSNYCATPPRSMLPLSPSSSSSLTPLPRPLPLSRPQLSLTPRLSVSTKHRVRVLNIRLHGVKWNWIHFCKFFFLIFMFFSFEDNVSLSNLTSWLIHSYVSLTFSYFFSFPSFLNYFLSLTLIYTVSLLFFHLLSLTY